MATNNKRDLHADLAICDAATPSEWFAKEIRICHGQQFTQAEKSPSSARELDIMTQHSSLKHAKDGRMLSARQLRRRRMSNGYERTTNIYIGNASHSKERYSTIGGMRNVNRSIKRKSL